MLKKLLKLAEMLDTEGFYKEADEITKIIAKWKKTPKVEKGKFTAWCGAHGHSSVNQACINAAASAGGNAAKMANFAVNANPGKWTYPKKKD